MHWLWWVVAIMVYLGLGLGMLYSRTATLESFSLFFLLFINLTYVILKPYENLGFYYFNDDFWANFNSWNRAFRSAF